MDSVRRRRIMKMIAERVDKWYYSGGYVGHLWKDLGGKKHDNTKDIMESYCKKNKKSKFIIDWERGELLVYE